MPSAPWPLVIFSHGLGGSSTVYSEICTHIASSGRVVLAMEHRDGSCYACIPSCGDPILYTREIDLVWPMDAQPQARSMLSFRRDQLAFRRAEVYHAVNAMTSLIRNGYNESTGLKTIDDCSIEWSSWSDGSKTKFVECDENVVLAGHSFGGATVLSILSNDPPNNQTPIRAHQALILDPWIEPLPVSGTYLTSHYRENTLEMLIINSEPFTLWKDHFERLKDLVSSWELSRLKLLTIVRSRHVSFSDFPTLPLVSTKTTRLVMNRISSLCLTFLDGNTNEKIDSLLPKRMVVKVTGRRSDGRPKRQLVGNPGDIVID